MPQCIGARHRCNALVPGTIALSSSFRDHTIGFRDLFGTELLRFGAIVATPTMACLLMPRLRRIALVPGTVALSPLH
jgi:hypothetical protein